MEQVLDKFQYDSKESINIIPVRQDNVSEKEIVDIILNIFDTNCEECSIHPKQKHISKRTTLKTMRDVIEHDYTIETNKNDENSIKRKLIDKITKLNKEIEPLDLNRYRYYWLSKSVHNNLTTPNSPLSFDIAANAKNIYVLMYFMVRYYEKVAIMSASTELIKKLYECIKEIFMNLSVLFNNAPEYLIKNKKYVSKYEALMNRFFEKNVFSEKDVANEYLINKYLLEEVPSYEGEGVKRYDLYGSELNLDTLLQTNRSNVRIPNNPLLFDARVKIEQVLELEHTLESKNIYNDALLEIVPRKNAVMSDAFKSSSNDQLYWDPNNDIDIEQLKSLLKNRRSLYTKYRKTYLYISAMLHSRSDNIQSASNIPNEIEGWLSKFVSKYDQHNIIPNTIDIYNIALNTSATLDKTKEIIRDILGSIAQEWIEHKIANEALGKTSRVSLIAEASEKIREFEICRIKNKISDLMNVWIGFARKMNDLYRERTELEVKIIRVRKKKHISNLITLFQDKLNEVKNDINNTTKQQQPSHTTKHYQYKFIEIDRENIFANPDIINYLINKLWILKREYENNTDNSKETISYYILSKRLRKRLNKINVQIKNVEMNIQNLQNVEMLDNDHRGRFGRSTSIRRGSPSPEPPKPPQQPEAPQQQPQPPQQTTHRTDTIVSRGGAWWLGPTGYPCDVKYNSRMLEIEFLKHETKTIGIEYNKKIREELESKKNNRTSYEAINEISHYVKKLFLKYHYGNLFNETKKKLRASDLIKELEIKSENVGQEISNSNNKIQGAIQATSTLKMTIIEDLGHETNLLNEMEKDTSEAIGQLEKQVSLMNDHKNYIDKQLLKRSNDKVQDRQGNIDEWNEIFKNKYNEIQTGEETKLIKDMSNNIVVTIVDEYVKIIITTNDKLDKELNTRGEDEKLRNSYVDYKGYKVVYNENLKKFKEVINTYLDALKTANQRKKASDENQRKKATQAHNNWRTPPQRNRRTKGITMVEKQVLENLEREQNRKGEVTEVDNHNPARARRIWRSTGAPMPPPQPPAPATEVDNHNPARARRIWRSTGAPMPPPQPPAPATEVDNHNPAPMPPHQPPAPATEFNGNQQFREVTEEVAARVPKRERAIEEIKQPYSSPSKKTRRTELEPAAKTPATKTRRRHPPKPAGVTRRRHPPSPRK